MIISLALGYIDNYDQLLVIVGQLLVIVGQIFEKYIDNISKRLKIIIVGRLDNILIKGYFYKSIF